ncbi:unnamed protein product [Dicrocoelium dendriticum]|nr:unnamed protein product [Dicrocoelium dendriticum]
MAVSGDHTFGLPSKQGELTAAELICGTIPRQLAGLPTDDDDATVTRTNSENGCVNFQQRVDCLMPVVHHTLRNASFSRGSDITAALCHLSNGEDLISMVDARELLLHFEVPLDEELTEQIFDLVMVEAPDKIMENAMKKAETSRLENQIVFKSRSNEDAFRWAVDWRLLAAFLDWKRNPIERERLRECGCQETLNAKSDKNEVAEAVKRRIRRAIDANVKTYTLSSEQYSGDRDGLLNPECWARLGSQSVRRKVPVPKVKRTLDYTNYGDETTIRSLLQPSIYAEYGLSSHDLLLPRTKQELRSIMDKCGLTEKYNLGNKFDQIWSKSLQLDKVVGKDTVSEDGSTASLHAFREALLEDRAEEIRKQFDVYYSNLCC